MAGRPRPHHAKLQPEQRRHRGVALHAQYILIIVGSQLHSRAELACLLLEHGGEIGRRTWIDLRERGTEVADGPELSDGDLRERAKARGSRSPDGCSPGLICGGASSDRRAWLGLTASRGEWGLTIETWVVDAEVGPLGGGLKNIFFAMVIKYLGSMDVGEVDGRYAWQQRCKLCVGVGPSVL
jgi:hypothetical protein